MTIIYYVLLCRFRTVSCQPIRTFTTHSHKCVFHHFPDFITLIFYITINKRFENYFFDYFTSSVQFFGDIILRILRKWNPDLSYRAKRTVVFSRRYRIQNAYGACDWRRHFHIDEHHYRRADNGPGETQPFVVKLKHDRFFYSFGIRSDHASTVPDVVYTLYDGLQPKGLK